jgi:ribosomal protein S9
MRSDKILSRAVGRRKEAVAQVQIVPGTGQFLINNQPAADYLQGNAFSLIKIYAPFEALEIPGGPSQKAAAPAPNDVVSQGMVQGYSQPEGGYLNTTPDPVLLGTHVADQMGSLPPKAKKTAEAGGNSPPLGKIRAATGFSSFLSEPQPPSRQLRADILSQETLPAHFNPKTMDTLVKVKGGGLIGQVDAIKLGVARALCQLCWVFVPQSGAWEPGQKGQIASPETRKIFKLQGFLTQDSRVKERKHAGFVKARKKKQFSKR